MKKDPKDMTVEEAVSNLKGVMNPQMQASPTDMLMKRLQEAQLSQFEAQNQGIQKTQQQLQGLEGKKDKRDLTGLAMLADMFNPGQNLTGQYQQMRGPSVADQRAQLEQKLMSQRQGVMGTASDLINAQRQLQKPNDKMAQENLKQQNKLDYLNQQYKMQEQLAGFKNSLKASGGSTGGQVSENSKDLTANMVKKINEGNQIPAMLVDVKNTIALNKDRFDPVRGAISSMNPYDEQAQTINAQMKASSQAFGRFMEGGVLRKEDEEKYKKMFPSLGDTPEIAENKLAIVNRLLMQKQKSDLDAFKTQGYNLSGLESITDIPAVPGIITNSGTSAEPGMSAEDELRKELGL